MQKIIIPIIREVLTVLLPLLADYLNKKQFNNEKENPN